MRADTLSCVPHCRSYDRAILSSVVHANTATTPERCEADRRPSLGVGSLHRLRHCAARQYADEVRAIFGAAMDVASHSISRDRHALERFRPKALLERLLERWHAE